MLRLLDDHSSDTDFEHETNEQIKWHLGKPLSSHVPRQS